MSGDDKNSNWKSNIPQTLIASISTIRLNSATSDQGDDLLFGFKFKYKL